MADAALVGLPERGQVDADLGRQRGRAEDRRLPVHDARAPPRRRAVPRARVRRWPTSPGSSRARPRAGASATSSSATSSGPGCSCCCSTSRRVDGTTRADPAEQERVLLDELGRYRPELLDRPRLVVGTKADVGAVRRSTGRALSAVTREGLDEFLGDARHAWSTRPAPPSPSRAVRRAAPGRGGLLRRPRRRRRLARARAVRRAGRRHGRPHERRGDRLRPGPLPADGRRAGPGARRRAGGRHRPHRPGRARVHRGRG